MVLMSGGWIMLQNLNTPADLYGMSDEELVPLCKDNEKAVSVLISRYLRFIRSKASLMENYSVESEDLMQEGLLALLNAIRTYKSENGAKFSTYAGVCIANRMTSALAKNNKNAIPVEDVEEEELEDLAPTPESILIEKEKASRLEKKISSLLSEKEWQVFSLFLKGCTYGQMAQKLNVSPKTVDNALQRVRRKLKSVWRADYFSN